MNLNPDERVKVARAIDEAVNSLIRIDAERDHIKNIYEMLKEEYELSTKMSRDLTRLRHKQSVESQKEITEELFTLYENLYDE